MHAQLCQCHTWLTCATLPCNQPAEVSMALARLQVRSAEEKKLIITSVQPDAAV